jgi:hypothetical protein
MLSVLLDGSWMYMAVQDLSNIPRDAFGVWSEVKSANDGDIQKLSMLHQGFLSGSYQSYQLTSAIVLTNARNVWLISFLLVVTALPACYL